MNLDKEAKKLLANVVDEWDRAEGLIKTAELHCGEVIFPAIQELRYAGRRMVEAFREFRAEPDSAKGKSYLQDAHFDCLRARHDALDAAMSKMMSDIELAVSELGPGAVLHAFPDYSKLMYSLLAIRERIEISRENRKDRDAIYASIESEELEVAFPLYKRFVASEKTMKAVADERAQTLSRALKHRNIAYVIAVGSIILAIGLRFFSNP